MRAKQIISLDFIDFNWLRLQLQYNFQMKKQESTFNLHCEISCARNFIERPSDYHHRNLHTYLNTPNYTHLILLQIQSVEFKNKYWMTLVYIHKLYRLFGIFFLNVIYVPEQSYQHLNQLTCIFLFYFYILGLSLHLYTTLGIYRFIICAYD